MGLFSTDVPVKNCLRCSQNMEKAQIEQMEKLTIIAQGLLFAKKSNVVPMVCPNCGYVEFVVENPSIFKKSK